MCLCNFGKADELDHEKINAYHAYSMLANASNNSE